MGVVLSCCVRAATYCHDRHNEWRYTDGRSPAPGPLENTLTLPIQDRLLRPPIPTSSMFVAVQDRNMAEVMRHLATAPEVGSHVNNNDETPLHLACRLGYLDIARGLLDSGCPADIITSCGSPLHSLVKSVKCGYTTDQLGLRMAAELVRQRGCNLDAVDESTGRTALHQAINASLSIFSEGLLLLGADPNVPDGDCGFTSLHIAAWQGGLDCVSLLLEQPGILLDARDNLDRTPLILALLGVSIYVQREPWPNQLYTANTHPDEPVRMNRYAKMALVEALLLAGADPNLADTYCRNAMVIAHGLLALEMLRYGNAMGYAQPGQPVPPQDQSNNGVTRHSPGVTAQPIRKSKIQESLFAPMLRILVMHGARFPVAHIQTTFMQSADWMKKIFEDSSMTPPGGRQVAPDKLVSLCRFCLRRHLARRGRLHRLEDLPLPNNLSNFVQIKYM